MLHRTWECFSIKKLIAVDGECLEMNSMTFYKQQWVRPNQWPNGNSYGGSGCLRTVADRNQWGVFSVLQKY